MTNNKNDSMYILPGASQCYFLPDFFKVSWISCTLSLRKSKLVRISFLCYHCRFYVQVVL
jgi:hypothetical protein